MHSHQAPLTIEEILSKAPGNPGLWHLFLAELAGAMQCDGGFLSVADLGYDGGFHNLYCHNVAPEQQSCLDRNFRKSGTYDVSVTKYPYQVFCNKVSDESVHCDDFDSIETGEKGEYCCFGVTIPLNGRYVYCLYLHGGSSAAEPELQGCMQRLQALLPLLQTALQKEQWLSLYSQITLLTGKHVAAYVIVDRALNVLFSDPVFNRIIAEMDCVEIRNKRLAFLNKTTEQRVLALMAGIGCETVTTQNQCACCAITVIPARALDNLYAWEFHTKGVALAFTNGYENSPTLIRLMTLYNLTKCEALCALQFIATPSIPDIAANNHRSTETVRNHIKSIMQKLDVHNQGALMKKLLAIAAL